MYNIFCGIAVIVIGLMSGGSIFTGNPELYDWFFDILGIGLILYGIYSMLMNRNVE